MLVFPGFHVPALSTETWAVYIPILSWSPLSYSLWQPDPNAPFQVPDHLRDAIVEFESTEVPAIGLKPRPVNTPTTGVGAWSSFAAAAKVTEEGIPPTTSSEDFEFINSYVLHVWKVKGQVMGGGGGGVICIVS